MADNKRHYGFRPVMTDSNPNGPVAIECLVATGQSFDVNGGASNVSIRKGDPLTLLAGGTVTLCDGFEGAGGGVALYGICAGIVQYWDAVEGVVVRKQELPADVAWSTNLLRASKVLVWPLNTFKWWQIISDGALADYAAFVALQGSFFDHTLAGASGTKVNPMLDISTNSTADGQWRLERVANTVGQDFAGLYVDLVVTPNTAELITAI